MEEELDLTVHLNNIQAESVLERKQALSHINKLLFEKDSQLSEPALIKMFETIRLHLLKSFSDKAECCREKCIEIASNFIKHLPVNNYYLTYIIPLIMQRIGRNETVEQSEELRHQLIQLLAQIVEKYSNKNQLNPFYEAFIDILTKTLLDKYSMVKRESCKIILKLVEYLQRDFHKRADDLIEPLIKCMMHQHQKVRALAVEAMGRVCLFAKNVDEIWGALGGKLLDQSPMVRLAVAEAAYKLLLEHVDRYSYWHRILPLMLAGLTDDSEMVLNSSRQLWRHVGQQYEEENEEELKDRRDYLANVLPDRYPEGYSRPSLGCRVLVERNITRLIPPIIRELSGWKPEMSFGAAKLLKICILHAEKGATQAMPMTIEALLKGLLTREPAVIKEMEQTCEIIGCLIPYKTWAPLIEPHIESDCTASHLQILAHILKGAHTELYNRQNIASIIAAKDVCQTRKPKYISELINVCENLLPIKDDETEQIDSDMLEMERNLYVVLITSLALGGEKNDLKQKALDVLVQLSPHEKLKNLHLRHLHHILQSLLTKSGKFTGNSVDYLITEAILEQCPEVLHQHWDIICIILEGVLQMDIELKIRTFTSLALVFLHWQSFEGDSEILEKLIDVIIVPNLIWAPGKSAEACRTAAASCLCTLVQNSTKSTALLTKQIPLLITLLEDDSIQTRLYILNVLALVPDDLESKHLGEIYIALGKRLDDSEHTIRMCAAQALEKVAEIGTRRTPNKKLLSDDDSYFVTRPYLLDIYKTVVLHMDDRDPEIRKAMFDALKSLGQNGPKLLMDLIQSVKSRYCHQQECDELQAFLKKILEE